MYEPIVQFLKAMKLEGFTIGVDTHLVVASVWKKLNYPEDIEAACDFLCPIIAQSQAEQEKFRRVFPTYAPLLGATNIPASPGPIEEPKTITRPIIRPKRRNYVVVSIVTTVVLMIVAIIFLKYIDNPSENPGKPVVNPVPPQEVTVPVPPDPPQPEIVENKEVSVPVMLDSLPTTALQLNQIVENDWQWFNMYKKLLLVIYIPLCTLSLGFFFWLNAQRSYATRRERGDDAPYQLPIKVNRNQAIALGSEFLISIKNLKGREANERLRISIPNTIAGTIKQGGLLDLRFSRFTQPIEYLLLIDINSGQNHQAQIFEYIFQQLLNQEIYAERFFFEGTPLWCWNERYPEGVALDRVKHLYGNARLVVLSNGDGFVSPVSGNLETWVLQMMDWNRRALLTPAPMAAWNYREVALSMHFNVLPSNIMGIAQVVQHFEGLQTPSLRQWKYELGANDKPIEIEPDNIVVSLSKALPAELLRWVAACALYPELHWDLTLRLGQALSDPDRPLVSFENVVNLARLPWFQNGVMPNAVRLQLLACNVLSETDRQEARLVILQVLEENKPENPRSYASEDHQLHLVVNNLLLAEMPEEKQRWLKEYRMLHRQLIQSDQVAIVELDRRFNRILDFPLPGLLRSFLFLKGRRVLGLKPSLPLLFAGLLTLAMGLGHFLTNNVCPGESVQFDSSSYCLSTEKDSLDFYTMQIRAHLRNLRIQATYDLALDVQKKFRGRPVLADFFLRLRKIQWNEARMYYQKSDMNTAYQLLTMELPDSKPPAVIADEYHHLLGLVLLAMNQRAEAEQERDLIDSMYFVRHIPNLVHLLTYDFVDSIQEGRIRVRKDARYGFLDSLGYPLWKGTKLPYTQAENYSKGVALVTVDGQQCIVDRNGITKECYTRLNPFEDIQKHLWGFKNEKGTPIIDPVYDSAWVFSPEGIARVKRNRRYLFIRQNGVELNRTNYTRARNFLNGMAAVQQSDGKWGYINPSGQAAIAFLFEEAGDFNTRGEAQVRQDGSKFTISRTGRCIGGNCPLIRYRGLVEQINNRSMLEAVAGVSVRIEGLKIDITTNAQGYFEFELSNITKPEALTIIVNKAGYEEGRYRLSVSNPNTNPIQLTSTLITRQGRPPIIALRGIVKDSVTGGAIGDVKVTVRTITVSTDARGQYILELPGELMESQYLISFSKEGYNARNISVRPKDDGIVEEVKIGNMVFVPAGTFTMGCTSEQKNCDMDEEPTHQVTLSGYYISRYEVTQKEWREVMGSNPSYFKNCDKCPVENVSWDSIQIFLARVKTKTGITYRLPTEAEWEYAARGGGLSRGYQYSGGNVLEDVAWYNDNASDRTHPVGQKRPNELGLYDMSGNVWECCSDWYGETYYSSRPVPNPKGFNTGRNRVNRGGSWNFSAEFCRVANRNNFISNYRTFSMGFRLARTP